MTEAVETPVAETQAESLAAATRDDLIAAVREAGGTESEAAPEAAAAAPAASPPAAETPAEEEEPRIARILKARETATAEREAARNHVQEMLEEAKRQSKQMIDDARAEAAREVAAERERLRAEFYSSPTAKLRALGDPQEISDAVIAEGTPQARAMRKLQEDLAETRKQASTAGEVQKQLDSMRAEQKAEREAHLVAQVRSEFLAVASKEAAPSLNTIYDANEIFQKANDTALAWRKGGMELVANGAPKGDGQFDFADVAKYLDIEARKRLVANGFTPAQQVSAGAPSKEPGNAPKVSANGPRTLSAAQGSERRTSPKPIVEMKPEEARAALIEEVAAARRGNPDAVF